MSVLSTLVPGFTFGSGGVTALPAVTLVDGPTVSIDTSLGDFFSLSMEGFSDITFVAPTPASANRVLSFTLRLINTGGGNVTWLSNPRWSASGSNLPVLTPIGTHILEFVSHDDGSTWYGFLAGNSMAPPA